VTAVYSGALGHIDGTRQNLFTIRANCRRSDACELPHIAVAFLAPTVAATLSWTVCTVFRELGKRLPFSTSRTDLPLGAVLHEDSHGIQFRTIAGLQSLLPVFRSAVAEGRLKRATFRGAKRECKTRTRGRSAGTKTKAALREQSPVERSCAGSRQLPQILRATTRSRFVRPNASMQIGGRL
jgi:hypothetical protein